MKKIIGFLTATMIIITSFSACGGEKILYTSDKLLITKLGRYLSVHDLKAGETYTFELVRVRRENADTEERQLTKTNTINIRWRGGAIYICASGGETVVISFLLQGKKRCL